MNPSAFTDYLCLGKLDGRRGLPTSKNPPTFRKRLISTNNICDASGKLWDITAHQFRHSVGTRMINNGGSFGAEASAPKYFHVPQHIIQRYLGHESPNMTATYAHLFDSTLKKEIAKYQGRTVNISGQVVSAENPELETSDLQWFKRNVHAQALPNGSCEGIFWDERWGEESFHPPLSQELFPPKMPFRPIIKGACPHANACLTCGDFRTTLEFLEQHKEQMEQTEKITLESYC